MEVGISYKREVPIWEIRRLVGNKAANEGLKAAEVMGSLSADQYDIKAALSQWCAAYGRQEVFQSMASPIKGAIVVSKPRREDRRFMI